MPPQARSTAVGKPGFTAGFRHPVLTFSPNHTRDLRLGLSETLPVGTSLLVEARLHLAGEENPQPAVREPHYKGTHTHPLALYLPLAQPLPSLIPPL